MKFVPRSDLKILTLPRIDVNRRNALINEDAAYLKANPTCAGMKVFREVYGTQHNGG